MATYPYRVLVSGVVDAAPNAVFAVIADADQHRQFLPKEFVSLEPQGDTNVWRTEMKVLGVTAVHTLTVTPLEPGRHIREADEATGVDTLWTFAPLDGGSRCEVTIDTRFRGKPGLAGWLERLITPAVTRGMYQRELAKIAAYLRA